jgi:hypothetical protein
MYASFENVKAMHDNMIAVKGLKFGELVNCWYSAIQVTSILSMMDRTVNHLHPEAGQDIHALGGVAVQMIGVMTATAFVLGGFTEAEKVEAREFALKLYKASQVTSTPGAPNADL